MELVLVADERHGASKIYVRPPRDGFAYCAMTQPKVDQDAHPCGVSVVELDQLSLVARTPVRCRELTLKMGDEVAQSLRPEKKCTADPPVRVQAPNPVEGGR